MFKLPDRLILPELMLPEKSGVLCANNHGLGVPTASTSRHSMGSKVPFAVPLCVLHCKVALPACDRCVGMNGARLTSTPSPDDTITMCKIWQTLADAGCIGASIEATTVAARPAHDVLLEQDIGHTTLATTKHMPPWNNQTSSPARESLTGDV